MVKANKKISRADRPVTQKEFTGSMRAIKQEFDQVREEIKANTIAITNNINDHKTSITDYIDASEGRIIRHFDVVAENIHRDVAGANKDEISLIKDKQHQHSRRLVVVEKRLGIEH